MGEFAIRIYVTGAFAEAKGLRQLFEGGDAAFVREHRYDGRIFCRHRFLLA
jgi:hypothetical protein